jgi:ribonuclease HI
LIYTDGSAIPNPGNIGYGVVLLSTREHRTFSKHLGIGSNLTAELCGLQRALLEATARIAQYSKVYIFCDCLVAVDLAYDRLEPRFHFDLVRDIRQLAAELAVSIGLQILWVPAHVGVPGNELADNTAKAAASAVHSKKPIPGQPKIPLAVARSIFAQAQRERRSRNWIITSAHKLGQQHLSRIKPMIQRSEVFFTGKRREQTALARLRLGHCSLAASRSRWSNENNMCECKTEPETVAHFLLRCRLHQHSRDELIDKVSDIFPGEINEDVLLGTAPVHLTIYQKSAISTAVFEFVQDTKREL